MKRKTNLVVSPVQTSKMVAEDLSDYSDDDFVPLKKVKVLDKYKKKYDEIKKEMIKRELNMNDILCIDLPIEEYIWFAEYFKILENSDEYSEERFRIKNMIYDKYEKFKNTNFEKLNKIKSEFDLNGDNDIIRKIINCDQPDDVKSIMYKKYKRCLDSSNSGSNSEELFKIIDWIDTIIELPTSIKSTNLKLQHSEIITQLWKSLNDNVYGLNHVKEKIMEVMCAKMMNGDSKGKILTLVGPPGVGKTSFAISIAQSLNMSFDQISFGSIKDSTTLTGHSGAYIGAGPGLLTKILLKSKRLDMVLLLDEIDKIPDTAEGKSISSVLLHVLDKTQNYRFRDMYMPEINLDLSKILFVCAANDVDDIDPVLRDRMSIINIKGYSLSEKVCIAKNHIFGKIKNDLKIKDSDIIINDEELTYLIDKKTENTAGMRDVERKLYELCERIILLKYAKNINFSYKIGKFTWPVTVDFEIIDKLL